MNYAISMCPNTIFCGTKQENNSIYDQLCMTILGRKKTKIKKPTKIQRQRGQRIPS